jgi:hypothetical protein
LNPFKDQSERRSSGSTIPAQGGPGRTDTRLASLLVRVAFDSGQTRSLVTNILSRQPGVDQDVLKAILDGSSKTAKSNIGRKTPQLEELIAAVEKWLKQEEEEAEERR